MNESLQNLPPWAANFFIFLSRPEVVMVVILWTLFWKGRALWTAAQRQHLSWFIILLAVNTLGLLEIAYLYYLNRFDLGSKQLLAKIESTFSKSRK